MLPKTVSTLFFLFLRWFQDSTPRLNVSSNIFKIPALTASQVLPYIHFINQSSFHTHLFFYPRISFFYPRITRITRILSTNFIHEFSRIISNFHELKNPSDFFASRYVHCSSFTVHISSFKCRLLHCSLPVPTTDDENRAIVGNTGRGCIERDVFQTQSSQWGCTKFTRENYIDDINFVTVIHFAPFVLNYTFKTASPVFLFRHHFNLFVVCNIGSHNEQFRNDDRTGTLSINN
jgi:hypothetical protein